MVFTSVKLISTLSAFILFSAFLLLTQKKLLSLVHTFSLQSLLLVFAILIQANVFHLPELLFSAALTLLLKVVLIPLALSSLIRKLEIHHDISHVNAPFYTLLIAFVLILLCYHIIAPISLFSSINNKNIVIVAMSIMLLGLLMMITRKNAISHVIGFMMMENGLFFAALMSTQGMPMVVELGIAFDLLVAIVLFGVFFFQIRSSIDSMDVDCLNSLREDL